MSFVTANGVRATTDHVQASSEGASTVFIGAASDDPTVGGVWIGRGATTAARAAFWSNPTTGNRFVSADSQGNARVASVILGSDVSDVVVIQAGPGLVGGSAIGFFGVAPTGKAAIGGSRAGIDAITLQLLAALAALGLVEDQTTP